MKKWKVECVKPDGSTATFQVDAPDRQSALEKAMARKLKVLSVEAWPEIALPEPPPPAPKATSPSPRLPAVSRSRRTRDGGISMIMWGTAAIVPALASSFSKDESWFGFGLFLSGLSAFLISVGTIYVALGRLGLDITEAIEKAAAKGRGDDEQS